MKSLRTNAALILTTLMLVVAAATPANTQLVQATNGNLYGTNVVGGTSNAGSVFKATPGGKQTTLYNFCSQSGCPDGQWPIGGLVQATSGNFYGTTSSGGANGSGGTVFKITPSGTLTTLYNFCSQSNCEDGGRPFPALIQATDGNFYGTTSEYGAHSHGTVFRITLGGTLTTLYNFVGANGDGADPVGGLVQTANGNFYGTTQNGGANGGGTVFKITPSGTLKTLYSFCLQSGCTDGSSPTGLIQATDGNFYGTTYAGGANSCPPYTGCGTVFKMTPGGTLTTLYSFCAQPDCADGDGPYLAGLDQGTDGNFYGTTSQGGSNSVCPLGCGTAFEITPNGTLTTLHTFCSQPGCTDGQNPEAALIQDTNGSFYGIAGKVFSLSTGLGPFVSLVRSSSGVGGTGGILGQGFTGTASVAINGTPAAFKVVSDTFLKATVPAGATAGFVTVTIPGGTLTSNKIFRVTPQLLNFDPPSGPVGTVVTITGVSLTQTTEVGFGDYVTAQFSVDSDTQVTATVPTGARTGPVGVQTLGGIARSAGTFSVTQ